MDIKLGPSPVCWGLTGSNESMLTGTTTPKENIQGFNLSTKLRALAYTIFLFFGHLANRNLASKDYYGVITISGFSESLISPHESLIALH